jgi:hypothetical protein
MARKKKSTPVQESGEGEEFSDVSIDSAASSELSGTINDPVEDGWVFPTVRGKAKREEYEAVREIKHINVDGLGTD